MRERGQLYDVRPLLSGDEILLGGTFEGCDWTPEVTEAETKHVVEGHIAFFPKSRA